VNFDGNSADVELAMIVSGPRVSIKENRPLNFDVLGRILWACTTSASASPSPWQRYAGKDCVGRLSPQQIVGDEVGEDAGDVIAGGDRGS
jgi:hypothetical protein